MMRAGIEKKAPHLVIKGSDFRPEVGDVADIISFSREFLKRYPSEKQKETLIAFAGSEPGVWDRTYHELVLAIGMKGGKNFVAEIIVAYTAYFISCLRNPHDYFTKITNRIVPYTIDKNFDIVNVSSVDESQARKVFFDAVKSVFRLTEDPVSGERWFEKYVGLDLRPGGFGDIKERIITFPQAREGRGTLRFMSFNSTATAPEGAHFFLFLADELSRADTKAKYTEASKLYDLGLKNTSVSFKGRVGKVIGWSYLNDTDYDLTNVRYLLSKTNDKIYGRLYTTFEYNPAITREDLADEYKSDPVTAKRIYECVKPKSRQNFFQPYTDKIKESIGSDHINRVEYKLTIITRKTKDEVHKFTSPEIISISGDSKPRCFAIDASKVRDRFCIVGGYPEIRDPFDLDIYYGAEKEIVTTNITPVIDFAIVIDPKGVPIDYLGVGDIIKHIIKSFPNTQSINSDHYQNEKLSQEIIEKGINSETYNFSRAQQLKLYTLFRANVWNNNLIFAKDPHNKLMVDNKEMSTTDLYVYEAEHIEKDGTKIDHPDWGSKDLLDAAVIVNHDLIKLEAKGVSEDIESYPEARLKDLSKEYMKIKYGLIRAGTKDVDEALKLKLSLKDSEFDKLKMFVKENYDY